MAVEQNNALAFYLLAIKRWLSKPVLVPLCILVFLGFLLSPKGWFLSMIDHEIEQFQIKGELQNLKIETIEKQVQGWMGNSFLFSDLEEIKREVEALAWVDRVTVSRVWPGTIVLTLIEQSPAAYWNEKAFLNPKGEVFSPQQITTGRDLPQLYGPEDSLQLLRAEMLAEMGQLQTLLEPYVLSATRLKVDERGSWEMTLSNGIHVALGSRPFDAKVERMATVLNSAGIEKQETMEGLDTRYPNGVAVKWKDIALASSK